MTAMRRAPKGAQRVLRQKDLEKVPGGQVEVFVPLRGDAARKTATQNAWYATLREITGRRPDWVGKEKIKRGFYNLEYAGAAWARMSGRVAHNIAVSLRLFRGAVMRVTLPKSAGGLILEVQLTA